MAARTAVAGHSCAYFKESNRVRENVRQRHSSLHPRAPLSLRRERDFSRRASLAGSLTLAISTAMIGSVQAEEVSLYTLVIEDGRIAADANPYAEPNAPYKARRSADSRHVRDIADTPQTMTVLTKSVIEESGKTELKDILSAQPGITLGTGAVGVAHMLRVLREELEVCMALAGTPGIGDITPAALYQGRF